MSLHDVSVMLTAFKRPHNLARQVDAIRNQTVKPREVWLFHNGDEELPRDIQVDNILSASTNLGVWPRFTLAMEMPSRFVCVFDDDTIPGTHWLENCITNFAEQPGLYGTIGVRFKSAKRRPFDRVGWSRPTATRERVDIVGHSWFLRRDWLRHLAGMERPKITPTCGEDYCLSYVLQQHGIGTYVPPHPRGMKHLWGSVEGELGKDEHALYRMDGEEDRKEWWHEHLVSQGWRLQCQATANP